jgi:hypothetical protein
MAVFLFDTPFATVATAAWLVSAAALSKMALDVKNGRKFASTTYRNGLSRGAVGGVLFGAWTVFRVAAMLGAKAQSEFQGELTSFVIFWFLMPPGWFFLEYYALDSDAVVPPPYEGDKDKHLEKVRVYADYASKIWAALSALLIGVAAIVFHA